MAKKSPAKSALGKKTSTSRIAKTASDKPVVGDTIIVNRRDSSERSDRRGDDRRKSEQPVAVERRTLERREKVTRRRQIDPTTCEREYSDAEVEFMGALDLYKRKNGRMFPTCSEILEVITELGYRKVTAAGLPAEPVVGEESAVEILSAAELPQSEG